MSPTLNELLDVKETPPLVAVPASFRNVDLYIQETADWTNFVKPLVVSLLKNGGMQFVVVQCSWCESYTTLRHSPTIWSC